MSSNPCSAGRSGRPVRDVVCCQRNARDASIAQHRASGPAHRSYLCAAAVTRAAYRAARIGVGGLRIDRSIYRRVGQYRGPASEVSTNPPGRPGGGGFRFARPAARLPRRSSVRKAAGSPCPPCPGPHVLLADAVGPPREPAPAEFERNARDPIRSPGGDHQPCCASRVRYEGPPTWIRPSTPGRSVVHAGEGPCQVGRTERERRWPRRTGGTRVGDTRSAFTGHYVPPRGGRSRGGTAALMAARLTPRTWVRAVRSGST